MTTQKPFTLVPAKPTEITLDTLPALFAHHRATFGGWSMVENEPAKPEGISDDKWTALGDTGRVAIVREREARQTAERALAASRARPAPPAKKTAAGDANADAQQQQQEAPAAADADAIAAALATAMKPFADFMSKQQEREDQREAQEAAGKVVDAVLKAAKGQFKPDEKGSALEFHNPSNALTMIDLTKVVDDQGTPDEAKISAELVGLLKRETHLGKVVDTRRTAAVGTGAGASGAETPLGDRVKDTLARMQEANGIRQAAQN